MPNRVSFISLAAHDKKPSRPLVILFTITNTGRQPIVVSQISAKYSRRYKKAHPNSKPFWVLTTRELPKELKPYEVHNEHAEPKEIATDLMEDSYAYFFVRDTKGKDWRVNRRSMKNIKNTLTDKAELLPEN